MLKVLAWLAVALLGLPGAYAAQQPGAESTELRLDRGADHVALRQNSAVADTPSSFDAELFLNSAAALIVDQRRHTILYGKNANQSQPIASISKLMTAVVVLASGQRLNESIRITEEDLDIRRGTGSRLAVGTTLPRATLLRIMLMASDNRAAHALARNYPGGATRFVARMNTLAEHYGMSQTLFADPAGLSVANVSTARDLATLVNIAYEYPLIREYSTTPEYTMMLPRARRAALSVFRNTNKLTKDTDWEIGLSKTGFINESGRCLVLQARIAGSPVVIVLLDSYGKQSRIADAKRIKQWLERHQQQLLHAS